MDPLPEDTFPLTLNETSAWNLRGAFSPGIVIDWPEGTPQYEAEHTVRSLRMKIDAAILRMIDEKLPQVDIPCTSQEAWAIDSIVRFDSLTGPGGDMLIQISRGLWHLDIGQHMTDIMPGKAKMGTVEGHEELYDHPPKPKSEPLAGYRIQTWKDQLEAVQRAEHPTPVGPELTAEQLLTELMSPPALPYQLPLDLPDRPTTTEHTHADFKPESWL